MNNTTKSNTNKANTVPTKPFKTAKKSSSKMINPKKAKSNKAKLTKSEKRLQRETRLAKIGKYLSTLKKGTELTITELAKAVKMDVFVVSGYTSYFQDQGVLFTHKRYNKDTKRMGSIVEIR